MLLGITPDPPGKARIKVIIGIIAMVILTANLIAQDIHLFRDCSKLITAKVNRARSRRLTPTIKLPWACNY
jgi:hypothetical protein